MAKRPTVLLVDSGEHPLTRLADRLHQLGFRALRAKTADQAVECLSDPRYAVGVVAIPPDLPAFDLDRSLAAFRETARDGGSQPAVVVAGPRPDADHRARLRAAGVRLGLWNPIDDHTLRFQVNRALAGDLLEGRTRRNERVPTNWPVTVRTGGRHKQAKVYSLSSGGAYLSTPTPSLARALVFVSLPLPGGDVDLSAEVLMTNVPGNLAKRNLPLGMAVGFRGIDPEVSRAITGFAEERARQLVL